MDKQDETISKKEAKRLWSHLFGEEDTAKLDNLTDKEFDTLVEFLDKIDSPIDWEADRSSKKVLLWKPKTTEIKYRDYMALILLFACMRGEGNRWLKPMKKVVKWI